MPPCWPSACRCWPWRVASPYRPPGRAPGARAGAGGRAHPAWGLGARRAARPVEELAEAAGRLGTGDPRPVGRRYGVTELDQVADGLDSAARPVTRLLNADRELAVYDA